MKKNNWHLQSLGEISSQILMSKKLVAQVIRVSQEEYINPFRVLADEKC